MLLPSWFPLPDFLSFTMDLVRLTKCKDWVNILNTNLKSRHVMKLVRDHCLVSILSLQPKLHQPHLKVSVISHGNKDCINLSFNSTYTKLHSKVYFKCSTIWYQKILVIMDSKGNVKLMRLPESYFLKYLWDQLIQPIPLSPQPFLRGRS